MAEKMISCGGCGQKIAASNSKCPLCGAKIKKPFYKNWKFWLIVAVVLIALIKIVFFSEYLLP